MKKADGKKKGNNLGKNKEVEAPLLSFFPAFFRQRAISLLACCFRSSALTKSLAQATQECSYAAIISQSSSVLSSSSAIHRCIAAISLQNLRVSYYTVRYILKTENTSLLSVNKKCLKIFQVNLPTVSW